jgi:hypothetical protein
MKLSNNRNRNRAGWIIAMLLAMLGGVAGCATTGTGRGDVRVRTIWEAGDQYVAIQKQDRQAGGAVTANAHPADVSADRLRSMLESVEVRLPGEGKGVRLFNDDELPTLTEHFHEGLASAGPDEDVTFAVIGHYPVLMGVLKERMVTTGRLYCQDGRLNIIFGDVHRYMKENEDRRLHPLLPGSRSSAASGEWTLATKPGGEPFTVKRPDWIEFPLAGPVVPATAPAAPHDAGVTGAGSKAAAPASPGEKPGKAGTATIEERLRTLNDLHDKKLITDEEYRAKRREILNEL